MKLFRIMIVAAALLTGTAANAQFSLESLKKSGLGSTLGNMLEGVFTKTDLEVADLVGEYVSSGPAVAFKSENFLKKAGGMAGAAALETKLQPYYEQYGLTGMPFTVDKDGNFTLKVGRLGLKGTLLKNDGDGTFTFNIMVAGMKLGQFTAYVEKTGKNLNLMFDATKLKELISTVGSLSGMKMAKTLATLLESYDGACVGFKMTNTGASEGASEPSSGNSLHSTDSASPASGIGTLLDRLRKK